MRSVLPLLSRLRHLMVLCCLGLLFASCDSEDVMPDNLPAVSFNGGNRTVQVPGGTVVVSGQLTAASGLRRLRILRAADVLVDRDFANELSADFEESFDVPADVPVGSSVVFRFELTDQQGRVSVAEYTADIEASTFTITETTIGGQSVKVLRGTLNATFTISADEVFVFDSVITVASGATLRLEPGTTVYMRTAADPNRVTTLVVARGGRLEAAGTKDAPVVFTSDKLLNGTGAPGDWGGIYLLGGAVVNRPDGENVTNFGPYGGNNDDDDSGVLRYVRIEYPGKGAENALNLYGVGRNTVLEYIQIFFGEDEGFKIKGGTFNLRYAVSTGTVNDHVEWEDGWTGFGQFWVLQMNQDREGDKGINGKNSSGGTPISNPTIANVTIIGPGLDKREAPFEWGNEGIETNNGTWMRIYNAIVTEIPDDAVESLNSTELIANGRLLVAHSTAFNNDDDWDSDSDAYITTASFQNRTTPVPGIGLNNYVGSLSENAFDPTTLDEWFQPAPFIGAVRDAASDWTADGNWCKNLDGSTR